jgi:alanyl-tRNA synthetase
MSSTAEIRQQFLRYFEKKGHAIVPSSPVVPHDDPTLLFTNAGMNQFKDVFLGKARRDYTRATTSQKCIRAGGKHNDLENVGHTKRHLTLFEMLGNFSFGDYFKKEAIQFAWEVSTEVFGFDPNRIWPTVFREDDEAFELWKKYVPETRITRFDEKDNFWAMGDTGPCGPCSELLYDRGSHYGSGKCPNEDPSGERFLEFWNLVFMQFNRDTHGVMHPLPKPSIDTGAGLERVVSLKMDVETVFETDVLRSLIAQTEQISGIKYDPTERRSAAFRVIADHLRSLSFAIADGAQPSNVDRGYVLRKILRRAVRYGRQIGLDKPFLALCLPRLVSEMGHAYPELRSNEGRIAELLTLEEESFLRTLRRGGNLLAQVVDEAKKQGNRITGDDAFKLKDTYGLPLEEIELIANDDHLSIDIARFQELEHQARERSRASHKGANQIAESNLFESFLTKNGPVQFTGYNSTESNAKVVGIVVDGTFVNEIHHGDEGMVILSETPFYAEKGGQIGDRGILSGASGLFQVNDTQEPFNGAIVHSGVCHSGSIHLGDTLKASVDQNRRGKISRNHTVTHLLHWALHEVLGGHVKQAGSVVDDERLRFDFSHHKGVSAEEIQQIEDLVNEKIRTNTPVKTYELSYADAQKRTDIKQFFGEKYGSKVRVVDIDFSKELCGGTHTGATGDIGLFRIKRESSISAGVRRIEGTTGQEAEQFGRESDRLIDRVAEALKTDRNKLEERVAKMVEENRELARQLKTLEDQQAIQMAANLCAKAVVIGSIRFLAIEPSIDPKNIRPLAEAVLNQLGTAVVVFGSKVDGGASLLAMVSDDVIARGIKAGDLIKEIAPLVDGRGGGKANMAQAGGKNPAGLNSALARAKELVEEALQAKHAE